jgi:hypothetical protein
MKFSRIGRRMWRRSRPKSGCGAKGRGGIERERDHGNIPNTTLLTINGIFKSFSLPCS